MKWKIRIIIVCFGLLLLILQNSCRNTNTPNIKPQEEHIEEKPYFIDLTYTILNDSFTQELINQDIRLVKAFEEGKSFAYEAIKYNNKMAIIKYNYELT